MSGVILKMKMSPTATAKLWVKSCQQEKEITRLQSEVERLRGRCGELEADANRFKFIARRESHQSMAMVNYEIACISGENPTEDQFREAVDEAMESAHRMSPQGAAPDMGGEK